MFRLSFASALSLLVLVAVLCPALWAQNPAAPPRPTYYDKYDFGLIKRALDALLGMPNTAAYVDCGKIRNRAIGIFVYSRSSLVVTFQQTSSGPRIIAIEPLLAPQVNGR